VFVFIDWDTVMGSSEFSEVDSLSSRITDSVFLVFPVKSISVSLLSGGFPCYCRVSVQFGVQFYENLKQFS